MTRIGQRADLLQIGWVFSQRHGLANPRFPGGRDGACCDPDDAACSVTRRPSVTTPLLRRRATVGKAVASTGRALS
jgi:hypothetical protein